MALNNQPLAVVEGALSHSVNTAKSLRFMSLLLLLVFALASAVLIHTALHQNAQAVAHSRFLVEKLLEARNRQLNTTIKDYAIWSAAYEHLHVAFNQDWAYERSNMGASLYETFGYEGVFLIAPNQITQYSVVDGQLVTEDASTWAGHQISPYIEAARQLAAEGESLSGFLKINSGPALVAFSAVTNDDDPTVPLIPGPESVLVWVDHLSADELEVMGREYGITALRFVPAAEHVPAALGVDTLDGEQLHFEWQAPRPGSELLQLLLPLLLLASVVLAAVIRLNLRNAVDAAKSIDAGYLAAQSYQAQLTFHAQHDPLTGLPNRALLQDGLVQAQRNALEKGQNLAVLLIDLDGFKPINDSHGHHYGDQVLIEVSRRLRSVAGPEDMVARLGGDEFLLLMRAQSGPDHFETLAGTALREIARPYRVDGLEFRITASAGLAQSSLALGNVERLVQQADLAMYAAKADGRNTVQWFDANLEHRSLERLRLRNDLQQALEDGQFELYFQPQICVNSLTVLGVEALLRWHHPTRGMVSPAEFIPLAEETGQIIAISRWVLNDACRQLCELMRLGHASLTMAVNISSMHLMRRDFLNDVQRALATHGVPAERLELEVTESVLLDQLEQAAATLDALRGLGLKIAIDDFGTGFSNLKYLRRLPVHRIKIDRSFIAELESSPQDEAIVEGILWLAHRLGLQVIAEGVETAAQSTFLAKHRCDGYQGYYFARPMAAVPLLAFLTDSAAKKPA